MATSVGDKADPTLEAVNTAVSVRRRSSRPWWGRKNDEPNREVGSRSTSQRNLQREWVGQVGKAVLGQRSCLRRSTEWLGIGRDPPGRPGADLPGQSAAQCRARAAARNRRDRPYGGCGLPAADHGHPDRGAAAGPGAVSRQHYADRYAAHLDHRRSRSPRHCSTASRPRIRCASRKPRCGRGARRCAIPGRACWSTR